MHACLTVCLYAAPFDVTEAVRDSQLQLLQSLGKAEQATAVEALMPALRAAHPK